MPLEELLAQAREFPEMSGITGEAIATPVLTATKPPSDSSLQEATVLLRLTIQNTNPAKRSQAKVRRAIEKQYLSRYQM